MLARIAAQCLLWLPALAAEQSQQRALADGVESSQLPVPPTAVELSVMEHAAAVVAHWLLQLPDSAAGQHVQHMLQQLEGEHCL